MEHNETIAASKSGTQAARRRLPRALHRLTAVSLISAGLLITGCGERPTASESRSSERLEDVTDTVPYHTNLKCSGHLIEDNGPTPAAQIARSMPGGLVLGLRMDDLPSRTDWRLDKSYTLDGGQWQHLILEKEAGTSAPRRTSFATVIDLDSNGTIDWIRVSTIGAGAAIDILARMRRLDGGRTSTSDRSRPNHCYYRTRHAFTSTDAPLTDAAIGEAAYCAAPIGCRISDKPLCSKLPKAPTLYVDEYETAVSMTLQGHGHFRPARPTTSPQSSELPICHSWNSQRPYL